MQIEHDHDEPPRNKFGNGIYWACLGILVFMWTTYLFAKTPDWWAIALGGSSGLFVAIWAMEITGNKTPEWMKR